MFNSLSDRLTATFKNLRGKGRLSEADIDATVREIRRALLDAQHPDALALAARAEGADPACLLNGYAWEAMLPGLLLRAGRPDLLRGLSTDPEAGALALSYRGRGASSRAAELASLLNRLVASGEEVLALVRSGKVDWDG